MASHIVIFSSLDLCIFFPQLAQGHRVVILNCMEKIIQEKLEDIDRELATQIVKQASYELTQEKVSHI